MRLTKTLEEKYGDKGRLGNEGELLAINLIKSWGFEIENYKNLMHQQVKGRDLGYKKNDNEQLIYVDVKTNINRNRIVLEIERDGKPGWFITKEPDEYFFVDIHSKKIFKINHNLLKNYVEKKSPKSIKTKKGDILIYLPIDDLLSMGNKDMCTLYINRE